MIGNLAAVRLALGAIALATFGAPTSVAAQADDKQEQAAALPARRLAFSPDGQWLAAAYGDLGGTGELVLWDVAKRRPRFVNPEEVPVPSVAYSPRGDVLAVGTLSLTARLLDADTGKVRRELAGHEQHARSVAFSPDGRQVATGSYDHTIKLWDPSTGEVSRTLTGHQNPLRVIAFSPDGKWLASAGGEENTARLWNLQAADQRPEEFRGRNYVSQVAFSADSSTMAVSNWGGVVQLIDVATKKEFGRLGRMGGVNWSAFSADGKWLAVATNGREISVFRWQVAADEKQRQEVAALIKQFEDDDYSKREAASQRLGQLGLSALPQLSLGFDSPSAEVRVRCRNLSNQLCSGEFAVKVRGHAAEHECLVFSPDSQLMASGDWRGVVKLWDVAAWKELATLDRATVPR